MPKAEETVLELDLRALDHNYRFLRSRLRPDTLFMAVVKAFAYGSDAARIAHRLERSGADYFAVAYAKEGAALRDAGIRKPIMVLHPQPVGFDLIIQNDLEPALYSWKLLKSFSETLEKLGKRHYPVHLKFNTGLNRLGFSADQTGRLGQHLVSDKGLKVVSIFSHLAASEDLGERAFTEGQIRKFGRIAEELEAKWNLRPLKHMLNTSGILNYPEAQYDMVRCGIGLYGFGNDRAIDPQLRPVATLKTVVSQLHSIGPDEPVGYNRAHLARQAMVTATLPLGHADGIGRHYGQGRGWVRVRGSRAPIIGNVCMDMLMVDVTGIGCKEGDEVTVFGDDPRADTQAENAGTISYELITGISQRVKRLFINDS